jgi:hypothetical protein
VINVNWNDAKAYIAWLNSKLGLEGREDAYRLVQRNAMKVWELGADFQTELLADPEVTAALSPAEIAEKFGRMVAELVDGVSKLDRIEFESHEHAQAENFRKMVLAMTRDVRVILIKLADRLHNMRTLDVMNPAKRARIARETIDIYAPIANRLGLNGLFQELQELSFKHLFPVRYRVLCHRLGWSTPAARRAQQVMDAVLVASLPVAALTGHLTEVVVLYWAPMLLSGLVLFYAFDFLPHYPFDSTERFHDTRLQPGRLRHALLLGQNYHLVHHLWVSVPWFRYRRVFTDLEPELRARNVRID